MEDGDEKNWNLIWILTREDLNGIPWGDPFTVHETVRKLFVIEGFVLK